jgi:hypothetical protein
MGFRVTGIVIAVVLFLPAGVLAQAKASGSAVQTKEKTEAQAQYDRGTVHFNLDEWPLAIEDFKAAYRLFPDATFLYNIAQCHRKMGNAPEALSFYKKYLRERPDAPNRPEVEKRIDELEAALAAQAKSREAPPPGVAPPSFSTQPAIPPAALPSEPPAAPAPAAAGTEPAAAPTEPTPAPALGNAAPPVPAPADMAPAGADVTTSAPAPGEAASSNIFHKWWFWTAAGAAVVAGGVVAIVALSSSKSAAHYQGNMDPPVLTAP